LRELCYFGYEDPVASHGGGGAADCIDLSLEDYDRAMDNVPIVQGWM
jgi:hypothetical protein